ncbi:MAG: hypothetical protein QOE96_2334 [Blastocatellia bacterium]|jgi:hypothetical protein|nr:hypothetical protein [Blastocatellia bacterium]
MGTSFVAYIDEAGDDGFTAYSSEWFVLSAVVTEKATDANDVKVIDVVRRKLSKPAKKPLHFRKLKHHQKVPYIAELAAADVAAVSVLIHKASLSQPEKFNKEHRLYHYAVRLLLERVSWLCRDFKHSTGDGSVQVVFSNRGGMSYDAISDYLENLLTSAKLTVGGEPLYDVRIAPGIIDPSKVSTYSHGKRMGLQLADAVASGIYNALETRYEFTEDRYARMLKPIVYCHNGKYLGYGLKFFPDISKMFDSDARLKWVKEEYSK